ncbi:MAG: DUF1593 domain-containing protein [Rikenellaceae bacterium]
MNPIIRQLTTLLIVILSIAKVQAQAVRWSKIEGSDEKARLIIMADMGNEPDEQQQMMHLLLYSNEFDLEGLLAVTGKYLGPHMSNPKQQRLYPELFDELIDGYAKVYKSLKKHDSNYPTPDYLHSIVAAGQSGYGSESIGESMQSDGSNLLVKVFERDDPRPIVIIVNAGSNTLAQALFDYGNKYGDKATKRVTKRLRVIENGAQDDSGAYICHNYPDIYWVRSNYQAYCYGGPMGNSRLKDGSDIHKNQLGPYTWEPYEYSALGQHQWALEHIIGNHGAFGAYWPLRQFGNGAISFVEGGGTVPWLCTINRGLSHINNLDWGGWSGRYGREKMENYMSKHESVEKDEHRYKPFMMYGEEVDSWVDPETGELYENLYTAVWRWRRALFNDFKYRMDWCNSSVEDTNHNPTVVIDGDESRSILTAKIKSGSTITIDASESFDTDGDTLYFSWYNYKEAGNFCGEIEIKDADKPKIMIDIPLDAKGSELHIILELRDNLLHKDAAFSYRRLLIECN